jgi:hypothetical protein
MTDLFSPPPAAPTRRPSVSDLNAVLALQLSVAWVGERSDPDAPRLGWWRSDLASEFGGEDLFLQLLPNTAPWAVLQAVREVARRADATKRAQLHNPDQVISIFHLGFSRDERLDERLQELKRAGKQPQDALPLLKQVQSGEWRRDTFEAWAKSQGNADFTPAPVGRRLKGQAPEALTALMGSLVAGLAPLTDAYPLPHFRSDKG